MHLERGAPTLAFSSCQAQSLCQAIFWEELTMSLVRKTGNRDYLQGSKAHAHGALWVRGRTGKKWAGNGKGCIFYEGIERCCAQCLFLCFGQEWYESARNNECTSVLKGWNMRIFEFLDQFTVNNLLDFSLSQSLLLWCFESFFVQCSL